MYSYRNTTFINQKPANYHIGGLATSSTRTCRRTLFHHAIPCPPLHAIFPSNQNKRENISNDNSDGTVVAKQRHGGDHSNSQVTWSLEQPPGSTSENNNNDDEDYDDDAKGRQTTRPERSGQQDINSNNNGKVLASLTVAGGLILLVAGGVLMKDQIRAFLDLFINLVDDWGPLGYLAYIIVYATLELLAVPAIPLTMTAGVIFGVGAGTLVVSIAATMAATGAFLIARYIARDKVADWADKNPKFAAIDRAIGKDGFRVVALLRLSPLLPLAASNYLYGLTSVDLGAYIAASWAGMLPGTLAYVAAGTYGRDILLGSGSGGGGHAGLIQPWQVALGLGASAAAVWYVGRLATKALADIDDEMKKETDKNS